MRHSLIALFFLSFQLTSFGQKKNVDSIVCNTSIKYIVGMALPNYENGDFISKNILTVISIDSVDLVLVKSLKKQDWIRLLDNTNADWAATLFLYYLQKKDGLFFKFNSTRDKWIVKKKKSDLVYWKRHLK
jgi:hypothetical protein